MNIDTQFAHAPVSPLATPPAPAKTEQVSARPAEQPSRNDAPVDQKQGQNKATETKRNTEASRQKADPETSDTPATEFTRNASAPASSPGELLDVTA